mmetsp:Transcript_47705/g.126171  ORF Transcript_47705/g.126171 Transcript_47705/m.126171 type:complete len:283 (-) Transcript_47705:87-935(-)
MIDRRGGGGQQASSALRGGHHQGLALLGDDHVLESAPHAGGHRGRLVDDQHGALGDLQRFVERGRQRPLRAQFISNSGLIIRIRAHPIPAVTLQLEVPHMPFQALHELHHRLPPPVRHKPLGLPLSVKQELSEAPRERADKLVGGPGGWTWRRSTEVPQATSSVLLQPASKAAGCLSLRPQFQGGVNNFMTRRGRNWRHHIVHKLVQVDSLRIAHLVVAPGGVEPRVRPAVLCAARPDEMSDPAEVRDADSSELCPDGGILPSQQVVQLQVQEGHSLAQLLL